jgi:hypothetical protein
MSRRRTKGGALHGRLPVVRLVGGDPGCAHTLGAQSCWCNQPTSSPTRPVDEYEPVKLDPPRPRAPYDERREVLRSACLVSVVEFVEARRVRELHAEFSEVFAELRVYRGTPLPREADAAPCEDVTARLMPQNARKRARFSWPWRTSATAEVRSRNRARGVTAFMRTRVATRFPLLRKEMGRRMGRLDEAHVGQGTQRHQDRPGRGLRRTK